MPKKEVEEKKLIRAIVKFGITALATPTSAEKLGDALKNTQAVKDVEAKSREWVDELRAVVEDSGAIPAHIFSGFGVELLGEEEVLEFILGATLDHLKTEHQEMKSVNTIPKKKK